MEKLYKAVGIVVMRELINKLPKEQRDGFINSLTSMEKEYYLNVMPVTWMPIDIGTVLFIKGGQLLYPDHAEPTREINRILAHDHLKGLYRFLFKTFSITTALAVGGKLWSVFHRKGKARCEKTTENNEAYYIVSDYPELTEVFRSAVTGYIEGTMEVVGAKSIDIKRDDSDPNHWKWIAHWK